MVRWERTQEGLRIDGDHRDVGWVCVVFVAFCAILLILSHDRDEGLSEHNVGLGMVLAFYAWIYACVVWATCRRSGWLEVHRDGRWARWSRRREEVEPKWRDVARFEVRGDQSWLYRGRVCGIVAILRDGTRVRTMGGWFSPDWEAVVRVVAELNWLLDGARHPAPRPGVVDAQSLTTVSDAPPRKRRLRRLPWLRPRAHRVGPAAPTRADVVPSAPRRLHPSRRVDHSVRAPVNARASPCGRRPPESRRRGTGSGRVAAPRCP